MEFILPAFAVVAVMFVGYTLWQVIISLAMKLHVANDAIEGQSYLLQRFNADQQVVENMKKMYIEIHEN